MKTSTVLASLFFGSFAVAAPLDPRRMVFKTEVVTETVVVYTTVYEDEPVAQATTTPAGYFYEQPKQSSSAAAVVSSSQAPAYTPPAVETKPSSTYVAPAPQPPTPSPAPVETPKPVESPKPVETPQPATSPAYVAPVPVVSNAAPAPTPAASNGGPSAGEYTNVDITIYDNTGASGACGTALYDTDMIVALAQPAWGTSTYDVMTGAATNPWCGQKIRIFYGDNHVDAKIMDLCPGCVGNDIDLSLAAWKALTGKDEKTRLKASWSKIS